MKAARSFWIAYLFVGGQVPLVLAQGDEFNSGAGGRCQAAREAEKRLHDANWLEIANERIEAGSERERGMIGCQGNESCFDRVAKAYGARERELQAKGETEISRHARALAEINAGRCSPPQASPAPPKEPSRPAPPPPDRGPGAGRSPRPPNRQNQPPPAKDPPPLTLGRIVRAPSNLAEIGCPECTCVDLKTSGLQVDQLVKNLSADSYNCFFYAKTFMEGRLHPLEGWELAHKESFADNDYMAREKYGAVASGINIGLLKAQIGDIIAVEGDNTLTPWRPWVHIAVVTAVDANGKILSTRQKPDPGHCVVDLSLPKFYAIYPVSEGHRYVLYRSHHLPGSLPRAEGATKGGGKD